MNFLDHFMSSRNFVPYNPPSWLQSTDMPIPTHKLSLGMFPTPVHPWPVERSAACQDTSGLEFWYQY